MVEKLKPAQIKRYQEDGYLILKSFFTDEELKDWEETVVQFYAFQALRIPLIKEGLKKGCNPARYKTVEDLDNLLFHFEEVDRKAGHFASLLIKSSPAAKRLVVNAKLLSVASELLNCPPEFLVLPDQNPTFLFNLPARLTSAKRLLYHWHSEMNSYPKRRSFLTFWSPTFRNKTANNGTMYFCKGSHIKKHDFAQYSGYDDDSFNIKDSYRQFETPDYELTEFEKVPVVCDRGDVAIFIDNLVHRSSKNETDTTSYTTVVRMFDYSRDLTLSHDATAGHFGGEPYARPGLLPIEYSRR